METWPLFEFHIHSQKRLPFKVSETSIEVKPKVYFATENNFSESVKSCSLFIKRYILEKNMFIY